MGITFQRIHSSMVGKFGDGIGEKIPQWIKANGGQFSRDVNPQVTHLVATKQAYKDNGPLVQSAKLLGTVKIVTYDWLEDSLLAATRRPKAEGPYLLENIIKLENSQKSQKSQKAKKSQKQAIKNDANKVSKKEAASKRRIVDPFIIPAGKKKAARRFYHDKQGLVYNISIFRSSKPPSKAREKYQLSVFETVVEPHTYSTYTKFSRTGKSTVEILTTSKSTLEVAVAKFKAFFKQKTGKEWESRADGLMPPPKVDSDGKALPSYEGWFYLEQRKSLLGSFLSGTSLGDSRAAGVQSEHYGGGLSLGDPDVSMEDQVNNAGEHGDTVDEENAVSEDDDGL